MEVEQSSIVGAPAAHVWARATTPEGINHELGPWLRMTVPKNAGELDMSRVPVGRTLGRSWVLLFGMLPVDYDDICIAELEPERHRFLERSETLLFRPWQHERTIDQFDQRTAHVTDRLTFAGKGFIARVPGFERMATAVVAAIFRHRHKRLLSYFGVGQPRGL